MATLFDTADYFIERLPDGEATTFKLHKLCAYAQGVSLAWLGEELFADDMEAWQRGSVFRRIHEEYQDGNIWKNPAAKPAVKFSNRQRLVLSAVKSQLGHWLDDKLGEKSHLDFPGEFGSKAIISKEDIRKAFDQYELVKSLRSMDEPLELKSEKFLDNKAVADVLGI